MAQALLDTVLGKLGNEEEGVKAYEILESYHGKRHWNTENMSHCMPAPKSVPMHRIKKDFIVTCDTYVTMTDGTGIVHIAPAFGEDDANVGRKLRSSVCTVCKWQR